MTVRGNTFEGGTSGATFTAAGSGGTSGDAFQFVSANGTFVYSNVTPAHGALCLKITPVATFPSGVTYGTSPAPVGGTAFAARACIRFDSLPTESNPVIAVTSDGSTRMMSIGLEQTGKVQIRDSATVLFTSASPNLIAAGTWYTFEIWGTVAAGTAQFHGRVYAGDNPTVNVIASYDSTTANTGTLPVQTIVFGKFLSTNWATSFEIDDARIDNAATGYIGPFGSVAPTVSAVLSPPSAQSGAVRTLTMTISNGNGNPVTWGPVSWGDGTTADPAVTTAAGVTTKQFSHTVATAAPLRNGSAGWDQA
jgi:hypothetical protein